MFGCAEKYTAQSAHCAMEKKPPCALDDEDLLDQGRLHPHVRLQEDPLENLQSENRVNGGHDGGLYGSQVRSWWSTSQYPHLSLVHEVDITVGGHTFLEEGKRGNLLEAKVEGDVLAGYLDEGQLKAVQVVVDALKPFQLVLVLALLLLVVEEHGDHVRVGDQLLQHVLRDVLDNIGVLALTDPG